MGGNAVSNVRRYQAGEYFSLVPDVLRKLRNFSNIDMIDVIPAYREKESFGDMDCLYCTGNDVPLCVDNLADLFASSEVVRNTNVISLEHKSFQIDLIHVRHEYFVYAMNYFKMNDFGNLAGKLFRRFGLKHGHNGLYLPLRDGNNKFGEILLTLDHDKALEFIGLDPKVFNDEFNTLQEIFEFVASSPNYNPDWYLMENISSAGRMRDKKRDTYRKFLEFGAAYTGPRAPKFKSKSECLERIFAFFPDAHPKFLSIMDDVARAQVVKGKFNGNLVQELTGLKEKMLGKFMEYLRADFNFSPAMIVYLTDEQISANIVTKYVTFDEFNR